MNDIHCKDNAADRHLGDKAERAFCRLAANYRKMFTAHQIGRGHAAYAIMPSKGYHRYLLPDITLWSAPGEHHEIKHKEPFEDKYIGLENYRLEPLKFFADETQQKVYYTIHRHDLAGGRTVVTTDPANWFTADIGHLWDATLDGRATEASFSSWVGGKKSKGRVPGWFWTLDMWAPLIDIWEMELAND